MPARDEWEEKFQKWKKEKERKFNEIENIERKMVQAEKEIVNAERKLGEEISQVEKEVVDYAKEPKHVKTLKIIAVLIPIILLAFIVYANFISSQTFEYTYDIGSTGENYLTPADRISSTIEGDPDYRTLNDGLVYFNVPIARGSETVTVQTRFKNNIPEEWAMSLGAKDQEVWHYTYNHIYSPSLNRLQKLNNGEQVYVSNSALPLISLEELRNKENVVVATNIQYSSPAQTLTDYREKETKITTSLRGAHTAYIYISGDLELIVKKQDINWYEGADNLTVTLYDLEDNLIANMTIEDDTTTEVKNKISAPVQEKRLQVQDLEERVYKIEFSEFDGVIKEIDINTNKIVFERLFLADSEAYLLPNKPSAVYTKINRAGELDLVTYHKEGLQDITYVQNGVTKNFDFNVEDEHMYLQLQTGEYAFTFPKNDIIISGAPYFSFSRENYFEPFKQRVIPINNDFEWMQRNVDYIVTDYSKPEQDGEWLIAETTFNIPKEDLFVKDNKLSFVFNVPHLSQEDFQNYTVPVDWIKLTVHKPGVFDK